MNISAIESVVDSELVSHLLLIINRVNDLMNLGIEISNSDIKFQSTGNLNLIEENE